MKRSVAIPVCFCALLVLCPPAVAADTGTIVGRVVNATRDRPQPGVRVTLRGANADGSEPITKTVRTDARGRYRFEGLRTGEERLYSVDATYQAGFFPSSALSLPSDTEEEPVIRTTLRVWETTVDPAAVILTRDDMFAVAGETGVGIIEAVTVVNQTDMAYIGRGADGDGASPAPSLGFSLPVDCRSAGVSIVDSDLDVPQLECTDFGFAITTAIPPGENRTTFSYDIPGETGSFNLSRTALYDIAEMSVFAADPLEIESNRLVERGKVTLAGKTYARWTTRGPIDPGDRVQVVAIAKARWTPGLIAGAAATLVFVLGLLLFGYRRSRRPRAPTKPAISAATNDDLIQAIAELDVAYERGQVSEEDWTTRRRDLKERLGAGEGT